MAITLPLEPRVVPLTRLENGVYRVTDTRIALERLIEYHLAGESPEAIVEAFDVLRLSDVYAVISYYLDHQQVVDEYIREQDREAEQIRREIESRPEYQAFREKMSARFARYRKEHGLPGQIAGESTP